MLSKKWVVSHEAWAPAWARGSFLTSVGGGQDVGDPRRAHSQALGGRALPCPCGPARPGPSAKLTGTGDAVDGAPSSAYVPPCR